MFSLNTASTTGRRQSPGTTQCAPQAVASHSRSICERRDDKTTIEGPTLTFLDDESDGFGNAGVLLDWFVEIMLNARGSKKWRMIDRQTSCSSKSVRRGINNAKAVSW